MGNEPEYLKEVKTALLASISQLAESLLEQQHLLEALAGMAVKFGRPLASLAVLDCMQASALALKVYHTRVSSKPNTGTS